MTCVAAPLAAVELALAACAFVLAAAAPYWGAPATRRGSRQSVVILVSVKIITVIESWQKGFGRGRERREDRRGLSAIYA